MRRYLTLLIILFGLWLSGYGQYKPFKKDNLKDSIWINTIIKTIYDTIPSQEKWNHRFYGKVIYSSDMKLRIGQIISLNSDDEITSYLKIQYTYRNTLLEKLVPDSFAIGEFIRNVYKIRGTECAYLFIGEKEKVFDNVNRDLVSIWTQDKRYILGDDVFANNNNTIDSSTQEIWPMLSQSIINYGNIDTDSIYNQNNDIIAKADTVIQEKLATVEPDEENTSANLLQNNKLEEQQIISIDSSGSVDSVIEKPVQIAGYIEVHSSDTNDISVDFPIIVDPDNPESQNNIPQSYEPSEENTTYFYTSAIVLKNDSLLPMLFEQVDERNKDTWQYQQSEDTGSVYDNYFSFLSKIRPSTVFPKPYLSYDENKRQIQYLYLKCPESIEVNYCNSPFLTMFKGILQFNDADTSFELISDTSQYIPSLESFTKIIAKRNFKIGNYNINATLIEKKVDNGNDIYTNHTVIYEIGSQRVEYDDEYIDSTMLKPNCRVQPDSSLLFVYSSTGNGHSPGDCGSCDYSESEILLITKNSKKTIFSYSLNPRPMTTSYEYVDQKGKTCSGVFFVKNRSTDEDMPQVDSEGWTDNSTYMFHVTSNENEDHSRNYFVHFITKNGKTYPKLKKGKLQYNKKENQ